MSARTREHAGPVAPAGAAAALATLPLGAVAFAETGMLGAWQELTARATLPHCVASVERSGAVDNLRRVAGRVDAGYRGPLFADSDVYKTLEAAAWQLARGRDDGLERFVDEVVELLGAVQAEDGYLNSWFQGVHPERAWTDLSHGHEMYCLGHLIQAAVALVRATGDDRLLAVARRCADLLDRRFGPGGVDAVPGHPEIETALVELSRETGERRYLALAERFVTLRGHGLLGDGKYGSGYYQDAVPVREATGAVGHAVRQLYLATGVTDVYLEDGDRTLLDAMTTLWDDVVAHKTYLTGGHGSRHRAESFGDPYELPPDRAYCETCAGIASVQWSWRLLLATGSGRFADELERALLNVVAAGVSRDGVRFFYSNPLQLREGHDGSSEDHPSTRLPWYEVACCPPNVARLVASLGHYAATASGDGVQLHLYADSTVVAPTPGGAPVTLRVRTAYPWDGHVDVEVDGDGDWELALRVPGWCASARASVDGGSVDGPRADGYLRLRRTWSAGDRVGLDLEMPPRVVRAHPRVDAVRGCVALARGPLVYCFEAHDQPAGVPFEALRLDVEAGVEAVPGDVLDAPVLLAGRAAAVGTGGDDRLYREGAAGDGCGPAEHPVVAIPYFRWANREVAPMRVWMPTCR